MTLLSKVTPKIWLPLIALGAVLIGFVISSAATKTPVDSHLAYSALQYFATLGPVALGLGLTMIAGEYDLSVGSVLGLAGCVAILTGTENPVFGLACGLAVGVLAGIVQAGIIVSLGLSSIPVTLGGLMTIGALSYVITGNQTVSSPDLELARVLDAPVLSILSLRSIAAMACYVLAAFLVSLTRFGRDLAASGSHRVAATTSGVRTGVVLVAVFAASGALSALSGVLLSYSLASASPSGLTEVLVPATAACIIGGVSLSGGRGHPAGVAVGVMTLCLLNAGLNSLGASPFMQNVAMGGVLFAVAVGGSPLLPRYIRLASRIPFDRT